MRRWRLWVPLGVFACLVMVVAYGLNRQEAVPQSRLVGQPLPDFTAPGALPGRAGVTSASFRQGQPRLLNVFASWCVPCIAEAPQLLELKRRGVAIDAIAVRDTPTAIAGFLAKNGDPFAGIGSDQRSRIQLLVGAAGVPETFVVDGRGVIRHHHAGNLTDADVATVLRELEEAR